MEHKKYYLERASMTEWRSLGEAIMGKVRLLKNNTMSINAKSVPETELNDSSKWLELLRPEDK